MNNHWMQRTEKLLGEQPLKKLQQSHVLLVGLGGVGSWAAEFLVRTGLGNLTIIDSDIVEISNINRQLPALHSTIGQLKTDVMKSRLLDINPQANIYVVSCYIHDDTLEPILSKPYDLIIDAIDTLSPKVWFLAKAMQKGYRIVSSMGSGARLDPTKIRIDDISKSRNCTLARSVRKRLHRLGITNGFYAVYSEELPRKYAVMEQEGRNKKSVVGSVAFVTAAFGAAIASKSVEILLENEILAFQKL